ncbi:hypothetical protein WN48_08029 [Eufriesea mexicana]|uniref:Uncharacterized protein n=1 Tax=Eufriesea mexicana TaxID=516756 RepID=A0A310SB64_9HYME|nr:hypothetical protein WN48_08029 [Eufriesea mexicana]
MHHTAPWYLPWGLKLVPLPIPPGHPASGIPNPGLHLLAPLPGIYAPEPRKVSEFLPGIVNLSADLDTTDLVTISQVPSMHFLLETDSVASCLDAEDFNPYLSLVVARCARIRVSRSTESLAFSQVSLSRYVEFSCTEDSVSPGIQKPEKIDTQVKHVEQTIWNVRHDRYSKSDVGGAKGRQGALGSNAVILKIHQWGWKGCVHLGSLKKTMLRGKENGRRKRKKEHLVEIRMESSGLT